MNDFMPEPKSGASTNSATPATSNDGRFGRIGGLRQLPSFGNRRRTAGESGNKVPTNLPTRRSNLVLKVNSAARVLHTRATLNRSFLQEKTMAERQISLRSMGRQKTSLAHDAIEKVLADPDANARLQSLIKSNLSKQSDAGCWLWTGPSDRTGYGRIMLPQKIYVGVHRLSYALAYSKHPGKLCVCHHCDTPLCQNPAHLFLGTHADNMADKVSKQRHTVRSMKGAANPASVLTASDVQKIRARIEAGETNVRIAEDYPVTHGMVSRIRRGSAWSHVD